jgi:hypothetical protein
MSMMDTACSYRTNTNLLSLEHSALRMTNFNHNQKNINYIYNQLIEEKTSTKERK